MKNVLAYILIALIFVLVGWFGHIAYSLPPTADNPIAQIKPTPLSKYSIEELANTQINPVVIQKGEMLRETPTFTSYKYFMEFDPTLQNTKDVKKISGLINIPKKEGVFPVIIMFRGYVDPTKYFTGLGTQHAGEFFAENGFITIAPDFLGYGQSDKESEDIFETRFQTYTTALQTLKSVNSLTNWDHKNIFIWGHSNGGQIALTTLEITGADYPTVLWAPVSKPFPYSILFYTDEASDAGKFLRQKTSEFENNYNSELFSLSKYLDRLNPPIQLNQGTGDEAVPFWWSDSLNKTLLELEKEVEYIKYPGADHNMVPLWNQAVQNSLQFYKKHLK